MSLFAKLLKLAVPLPKIEAYERYLFVAPHPDDIEIACGSTAAKLAQAGKEVHYLICTDGGRGCDGQYTEKELADIRRGETLKAAAVVGIPEDRVHFLPYPDGGGYDETALQKDIMSVISAVRPDFVFCPDDKVPNELHVDHVKCGHATGYAFLSVGNVPTMKALGLQKCDVKGIAYYYTDRPNQYVRTGGYLEKSIEALHCHASQFPQDTKEQRNAFKYLLLYIRLRCKRYGLKPGNHSKSADGFRVQGQTHSHCAPEMNM